MVIDVFSKYGCMRTSPSRISYLRSFYNNSTTQLFILNYLRKISFFFNNFKQLKQFSWYICRIKSNKFF